MIKRIAVLTLAFSVWLVGCGKQDSGQKEHGLTVFTSIPPIQWLVEEIGGEKVNVNVLLKPGRDLHVYEPTTRQMIALAESDLFFSVGLPFEKFIAEKTTGTTKIVDLTQGVTFRRFDAHACTDDSHDHHDHGGHDHGHESDGKTANADPHIWLGPKQVEVMAGTVLATLISKDSSNKNYYEKKYEGLIKLLKETDKYCSSLLESKKGSTVMVFHPSFGYFLDHYHLKQEAIEVDGKTPSAKQLITIINKAKHENIRTLFIQPQFDKRSAETIAQAIGGSVKALDPLAKNIVENARVMAELIAGADK